MVEVPVVVAVISTELLVAFAVTSKAFRAKAIVEKDRGDDVREAVAGLEAAKLIPRLAALFEYAERIRRRRGDELADPFGVDEIEERRGRIEDLLSRGGDIAPKVTATAQAGEETRVPIQAKERLVSRLRLACWPLTSAHVTAPLFLADTMFGREYGPQALDTGLAILFAVSVAVSLVLLVAAWLAERALSDAIAEGKDASPDEA